MKRILNSIFLCIITFALFASIDLVKIDSSNFKEESTKHSTLSAKSAEPWQAYGSAIDISISDDYYPIHMPGNNFKTTENRYYIKERLQTYTRIDEILLRSRFDSSLYIYAYRIVSSPQDGRSWGFAGIGSYGGQWVNNEIKTQIQLGDDYDLLNYKPINNPSTTTGSIGVGYDSSGFSVSASVDYEHSELSVISNSNMGTNYYETCFKIDNIFTYPFASNYAKGDIFSFGLLYFQYSGIVCLDVQHEITYTDVAVYTGNSSFKYLYKNKY